MSIKLIGLDIDGTLLTRGKRLTPRTCGAIEAAAYAGIRVAYLTGRPLSGITEDIRLDSVGYIVSSNGAVTHDAQTGAPLRGRFIPKDAARGVAVAARQSGLNATVFTGGLGYCESAFYAALMAEYEERGNLAYGQASRRPTDDLLALIDRDQNGIENICVDTNDEEAHRAMLRVIANWPELRLVTTRGNRGLNLEIGHPEADKGLAFLHLAGLLGIDRADTLAIGDDGNDLGLLRAAGTAVAMGNATDEVKRACAWVTEDNEHDGAAKAIERIIGN